MVNSKLLNDLFGIQSSNFEVYGLGVATTQEEGGILTFLDCPKYAAELNQNETVKVVFVKSADEKAVRRDIVCIVVDDPKWYFFSLINHLAKTKERVPSRIAKTASIHPSAYVDPIGVVIGDNVVVEPNVTILKDTIIKQGVIIRAGAVLGVDGFEHKKTSRGLLSVVHDGNLIVGKDAEIGPNNTIIKGFSYRDTIIGEGSKFDALVHYAHGVQCGKNCLFAANAMIAGHVAISDNVWVGPSVSISNRLDVGKDAYLTMGAVVVKNVSEGEKVTGNFAIPHKKFISNLKASVK